MEFYKKNEKLFLEAVVSEDLQKYDGFYSLIKEKEKTISDNHYG